MVISNLSDTTNTSTKLDSTLEIGCKKSANDYLQKYNSFGKLAQLEITVLLNCNIEMSNLICVSLLNF